MAYASEYFRRCGPIHLSTIDWNNPHHQMSVSASLVQGVYLLEDDRQASRRVSQCFAPLWWEFFGFKLNHQLVDDYDHSIFGAIFECKQPSTYDRSPQYVVAFRGTVLKQGSFARDLELDIKIIRSGLDKTSRFKTGMNAVQDVVSAVGSSKVWIAGHSLGAAMVLLTGKNMAKGGNFLEAFLFNPPYVSPPIERVIEDERVRHGLRFAGTLIKAGLAIAAAANDHSHSNSKGVTDDSFGAISGWIPSLFVNRYDPICSEYIGYFEHRKKLEDIGAGSLARLTCQHSLGNIALNAMGITEISEAIHLVPSANVTVNLNAAREIYLAHGLNQWLRPDLNLSCCVYKYK